MTSSAWHQLEQTCHGSYPISPPCLDSCGTESQGVMGHPYACGVAGALVVDGVRTCLRLFHAPGCRCPTIPASRSTSLWSSLTCELPGPHLRHCRQQRSTRGICRPDSTESSALQLLFCYHLLCRLALPLRSFNAWILCLLPGAVWTDLPTLVS